MPSAPLRYCAEPGCSAKGTSERCATHARAKRTHERRYFQGSTVQVDTGRYLPPVNYGRRWQHAAKQFLARNRFCIDCQAEGNRLGLATEVDHEEPHRGDPTLFWDETNWRPRCKPHHSQKTAREVGFGTTGGTRNV